MSLVSLVERLEELAVVVLRLVAQHRQEHLVLAIRRRLMLDVRLLTWTQHLDMYETAVPNYSRITTVVPQYIAWLHGTVVERRSLTGELSLSCARPAADG